MFTDKMTIYEIAEALRNKDFSARELAQSVLDKCSKLEKHLGAYLTLTKKEALQQAEHVDKFLADGRELPLLAGIPIALKDNIAVKDIPCTSGSKMLENFLPPYNAFVWEQLQKAEAVLIGKTNMDEFAMGFSTENSYFNTTKNPHDLSRIPGGSSGGSAAAVACGEAICALGTDTGGSIRQPASYCGVVGLRPTYGLISRRGVTATASSMDTVGPLTRTVRDNMIVLSAISAWDAKDCSSSRQSFKLVDELLKPNTSQAKPLSGITIGWPDQSLEANLEDEVMQKLAAALKTFEYLGAKVKKLQIKTINAALSAYYVLVCAEAASNLGRYDGIHYGYRSPDAETLNDVYINSRSEAFGYEVKRRILLGNFALSEEYYENYFVKAQKIRSLVIREFEDHLNNCDVILMPASTSTAEKIGSAPKNPVTLYSADIYTTPVSLAGLPALSLPCGKDSQGLPIGMQLVGKQFSEDLLYRIGAAYEDQHSPAFELAEVKI